MYDTFSGSRVRRYLVAAVGILIFLMVVLGIGAWTRHKTMSVVRSTPVPLAETLPTLTPTPTAVPPTVTPTAKPCPSNPDEWHLVEIFPDNHLMAISPACVYEVSGLYQVLRWEMLTSRGYTGPDAAKEIGFDSMPVGPNIESIGGITSLGSPQQIPLGHLVYRDDYAHWLTTDTGEPLPVQYSLRGCFRPFDVSGGNVQDWGTGYDIICTVAVDVPSGWAVNSAGGSVYSMQISASREFRLYGYTGEGWVQIGVFEGLDTTLDDEAAAKREREDYNRRTGWMPDAVDVSDFPAVPLPDGWRAATDPSVLQDYFSKLNAEMSAEK